MSVECRECERDARSGHDPDCSRYLRAIDALIAEKVFGEPKPNYPDPESMWSSRIGKSEKGQWYHPRDGKGWQPMSYSTSWNAIGQVIEKLRELGYLVRLESWPEAWHWAYVGRELGGQLWEASDPKSMPLAICKAALKAIEAHTKQEDEW